MRPPYGTNNFAEHFNLQWLELIGNKVGLSDSPSNPFDLKRLTETTLNGSSSLLKGGRRPEAIVPHSAIASIISICRANPL